MALIRLRTTPRISGVVIAGGIAYLSGQVPSNLDADIEHQTLEVLGKIDMLLTESGIARDRLLNATIYLKDMDDFDLMNHVWEGWLAAGGAPARTTVQANMAKSSCLIEITVQAHAGQPDYLQSC
ncbi:RidA family protein [Pectobacterium actinidiae]|uniref:RidA family protein n=1 Tax=Pectobacterium actinidiae TaxID=1507808 RepID=UPI003814B30F